MKNPYLVLGSLGSFAVASLHLWIVWNGAPAYRFFGAGEAIARAAEQGSTLPGLLTLGIASAFALFGVYAWLGTQHNPLPYPAQVLGLVAAVYILRGLGVVVEIGWQLTGRPVPWQNPWFSAVSLLLGVLHILGLRREPLWFGHES